MIDTLGAENPSVEQVLRQIAGTGSLREGVLVTFFTMVGIFAACFAVQTVVRARQEETHGTAELLLSTPLSRVRWLGAFLLVGIVGVVIIAAAAVIAAALGMGSGDAGDLFDDAVIAGLGQALAASVFLGITGLVFVLAPRATIGVGWSLVALATVLGLFGPLFGAPDWAVHLSPFATTPLVDEGAIDARGGWWLLVAAAVGVAASLSLMSRRELAAGG